jgi:hypothetical protein
MKRKSAGSLLDAVVYLKPEQPPGGTGPVTLDEEDAPVTKRLGNGLLVMYLMDMGDVFSYVQGKHLHSAGIDADELHTNALANLKKLSDERGITIRRAGPISGLILDGNFEASLILLDEIWEHDLRDEHAGEPIVALPSRDVLCFCDRSSTVGIAELRAVIGRVWPLGDHLISDQLFRRRDRRWQLHDDLS